MRRGRRLFAVALLSISLGISAPCRADMFGGDVVVLTQILANAIQQLIQLRQILTTGSDTLGLLREINSGVRDGLLVLQILDPQFKPGIYGDLHSADQVLSAINDLYGHVPQTGESRLQQAQDQSVAESIAMNSAIFNYADQTDAESRRIFNHALFVSPQGAGKLTAQSVAVLIGVTNQVLRTNSMMLKMMSENLALQNRKEKIQSAQFKSQYDGLSSALDSLPKTTKLQPLQGSH
jgi:hypothetical protein